MAKQKVVTIVKKYSGSEDLISEDADIEKSYLDQGWRIVQISSSGVTYSSPGSVPSNVAHLFITYLLETEDRK